MSSDFTVPFWVLTLSYWIHLLATVVWLGGIATMAVIAWPSVRGRILEPEQWAALQKRFTPFANASLVLLWITGFVQMTSDSNYEGFLALNSLWAQAILVKHIAVIGMMVFGIAIQWRIQPALARLAILEGKQPEMANAEREKLRRQEIRLLRINMVFAALVLFFTAVATAI